MRFSKKLVLSLGLTVVAATILLSSTKNTARADSHIEPAIAAAITARQSQMRLYGFHLGQLGAMAKGKTPYDAGAATAAANFLSGLSNLGSNAMWPQGSDSDSVDTTRALPALWKEGSDVGVKSKALSDATAAMAEAAAFDLASLQGAMGAVGEACKACHKAFRKPKD